MAVRASAVDPSTSLEAELMLETQTELLGRIARTEENLKRLGTSRLTKGTVESRLQTLESNWSKFQKNHDIIRAKFRQTLAEHEYFRSNRLAAAEDMVVEQRGVLLDMLESLRTRGDDRSGHPSAVPPDGGSRRKPPHIELPHFSGHIEDWPAFRDLFGSILAQHPALTDVERLHYLKTRVQGEAEERIRNLPTIGPNFQRAWAILEERYENKRVLVRSCLSAFTATPKMKGESVADLKRLVHCMLRTAGNLESIGRKTAYDNDFFVHTVIEMLDARSRREWEDDASNFREPPTYEDLREFLERRLRTVEALSSAKGEAGATTPAKPTTGSSRAVCSNLAQNQQRKGRCPACQKDHYVLQCSDFQKKTPAQRKEFVEGHQLCINCLGRHPLSECQSKKSCLACSARHHTTIHDAYSKASPPGDTTASSHHVQQHEERAAAVLLATARVRVTDMYGDQHTARALIDPGSELSLISETLSQRLRLPRLPASVSVYGVGGQRTGATRGRVSLEMSSSTSTFTLRVSALVLPRISAYGTRVAATPDDWPHLRDLSLANPDFRAGDPIDILLGADVYSTIIEDGLRKGGPRAPIAQRTALGWILSGVVDASALVATVSVHQCHLGDANLSELVRQFWHQEKLPGGLPLLTAEEQQCEDFYATSHTRQPDGRYMVRLPVAPGLAPLSGTRRAAERLIRCMEGRFRSDPELRQLYHTFMGEYEQLSHMVACPPLDDASRRLCYLPHHGVLKGIPTARKIRVVFNGSSRLPTGDSLNAYLSVGPNLLPALADVLLRWRQFRFVLAADVEKMYRQILVHPEDRDLQRILWRSGASRDVQEYQLCTVTYGLACAPFLAIRTLRQLATDEETRFPHAAVALRRDTYMDDIMTGADTLAEAQSLRDELVGLCSAGGFPLRKWAANSEKVLLGVPPDHRQIKDLRAWEADADHSALGLLWHPRRDYFSFRVQPLATELVTKRSVLSQTARLFDPMGWLAPVVIAAKIIIQTLWLQHLEWD
ncbi:uncharacterized protein LOC118645339 [Monomorium pharaonis]|uniref:uncharacterized protein LOC118645339 n=1 Tax=Monomorium pharaonis TaxID=307658 RepID=UPI0017468A22|nr:uncharacterized protein LOC118645339 [Monomorium pharaonis]